MSKKSKKVPFEYTVENLDRMIGEEKEKLTKTQTMIEIVTRQSEQINGRIGLLLDLKDQLLEKNKEKKTEKAQDSEQTAQ